MTSEELAARLTSEQGNGVESASRGAEALSPHFDRAPRLAVLIAESTAPARGFPSAFRAAAAFNQDTFTLGAEGQVILQWPQKLSQDSYDELKSWIELQLKKIARLNDLKPPEKK